VQNSISSSIISANHLFQTSVLVESSRSHHRIPLKSKARVTKQHFQNLHHINTNRQKIAKNKGKSDPQGPDARHKAMEGGVRVSLALGLLLRKPNITCFPDGAVRNTYQGHSIFSAKTLFYQQ
jgi:hypothetical protein